MRGKFPAILAKRLIKKHQPLIAQPLEVLKQNWGYDNFRAVQQEVIEAVLEGQDALVLLPTGGGKSLCFQVPALCREGLCLVISPLIALMKDQVENLKKRGIAAAAIFSGMHPREIDLVFENAVNGAYKLLYLSPERLKTELARARIARMNINLLAVDEAHCISQWGYDFRPPYLEIAEIRRDLPEVPVLALTATATSEVVVDIQKRLDFRQPQVFRQSFSRPNLSYSVLYESRKKEKLLSILRTVPGCGIVYVRTRGECKEIANFLVKNHISADAYHAGLTPEERATRQQSWVENRTRIMVCTNAFGMGIDKPNVRLVVHLHLPDSLEAYFQEAGRAGRDGQKSYAVLLFEPDDAETLRVALRIGYPEMSELREVYRALGSHSQLAIGAGAGESFDFDFEDFCRKYNRFHPSTHASLRLLEREGWIAVSSPEFAQSQVIFTASRDEIYDFQLRSPAADLMVKTLFRAYPGIQQNLTEVNENSLARWAKTSVELVIKFFENAQLEGLLEYFPFKNKPQLTFLRERVAAENLTIDLEKFNFRRERAEIRVERAIRFAETLRCRSQQLLEYFEESGSEPCGICDVCTGRNKPELSGEDLAAYSRKIRELLRDAPLDLPKIFEAFAEKHRDLVSKTLVFLESEGKIGRSGEGFIFWKN